MLFAFLLRLHVECQVLYVFFCSGVRRVYYLDNNNNNFAIATPQSGCA